MPSNSSVSNYSSILSVSYVFLFLDKSIYDYLWDVRYTIIISSLLSSFTVWTKNSWEHLTFHLILVSVVYDQLIKSQVIRSKEKNWSSSVFTHKPNKFWSLQWRHWWQKTLSVRIWFWNFDHQNLTIALFLVSSFANGSIFFMENANPIYLFFIFLLTICRCERLCEIKEEKY